MALNFDAVKLDTVEAQGGYGVGLQIGQQLIGSGLDVETDAVMKGIFDVLNQNAPAVELDTVTSA
jgi:FKBP-type peptidyl-prolyl cis-trans isomerase FklB